MTPITYWHRHPRGFSNECEPLRCETPADRRRAQQDGYERLTLAELRRHVRWLNAENAAWGSNRAVGRYHVAAIQQDAAYCASQVLREAGQTR